MAETLRVCVVTTSRADYGIYQPLLEKLEANPKIELMLAVGGQHIESRFGNSIVLIEQDGYEVVGKVPCFAGDENPMQTVSGIAQALEGFAAVFQESRPDLGIVLGDRYEMFAAATAAYTLGIPIGHIAGGDVTTGALDDAYRHSISKMATLHFTTSKAATRRLVSMGENPNRVFTTGTPALDHIADAVVDDRQKLDESLGFELPQRFVLVTFHPETTSALTPRQQVDELLGALDSLDLDVGVLVTGSNADPGSAVIREALLNWIDSRDGAYFVENLGLGRYLNALSLAVAVVGNSSSALYEAPATKTWSIDIGDRQRGRERAPSVIHVPMQTSVISHALDRALNELVPETSSPYGDGNATDRIVDILLELDIAKLSPEPFYEDRSGSRD